MKFLVVFLAVVLAALVGVWAGRRLGARSPGDPGVESNARIIGYTSLLLAIPLAAEVVTGIRPGLTAHAMVGFLLVPPVLLKLGAVGYRFVRYYTGNARYVAAGPPELVMRVMGPILVLLTVALFATGIELWLFGFRYGQQWLTWHQATFVLWFLAMTVHVVAYLRQTPQLAIADARDRLSGAVTRRSLVVASLLVGALLAVAMLPFPSPFTPPSAG